MRIADTSPFRDRDLSDVHAMGRRIHALERQTAEIRDKANALAQLQHVFVTMTSVNDPTEILKTMLCAARNPLGFSRAIVFSVERESGIEARLQLDGSDVVEISTAEPDLRDGSAFLSILREQLPVVIGTAHDLSAPMVDVRSWYVASALMSDRDVTGILYVDGHASKRVHEDDPSLVHALTSISAVMYERAVIFAKTNELAIRDSLTGLLNRRGFNARLSDLLNKAKAGRRELTYVLIDVDDFKHINDTRGHPGGDDVLRRIATTLVRSSRTEDIVGRYAGDEFNVILDNVDRELARTLVGRLSNALRDEGLPCSLGAAHFPEDASDASHLLRAADVALYGAKHAGKNTFAFYSDVNC